MTISPLCGDEGLEDCGFEKVTFIGFVRASKRLSIPN